MVTSGETRLQELARPLAQAVSEGYAATDADLLDSCRQIANHYSSSTSVTCLVSSGILSVGHLGDSRCYLVVKPQGGGQGAGLRGVRLTEDHKPDDPEERKRIETSGGSIQMLHHHNNKPFIRGGDFDRRKASGERVMQLQ
jgi:protein phosphatase